MAFGADTSEPNKNSRPYLECPLVLRGNLATRKGTTTKPGTSYVVARFLEKDCRTCADRPKKSPPLDNQKKKMDGSHAILASTWARAVRAWSDWYLSLVSLSTLLPALPAAADTRAKPNDGKCRQSQCVGLNSFQMRQLRML